jgi:hypothetical protein
LRGAVLQAIDADWSYHSGLIESFEPLMTSFASAMSPLIPAQSMLYQYVKSLPSSVLPPLSSVFEMPPSEPVPT